MIFDGHGDVWTDVTCRAVDHGERDIFRKHHLHKFQEGGVTGGIFVRRFLGKKTPCFCLELNIRRKRHASGTRTRLRSYP